MLDGYEPRRPSCKAQADIIRLLLLTGCRSGEMLKLRWREVEDDTLELEDSKTGPRQVLLSPEARAIIEQQPRSGSPWVFPSPVNPARARVDLSLWKRVLRKLAGIEDVRLHDLRHTFASQAAMQGIPLPVVARLLGHAQVQMTLRYAHVSDRDVEAAADRIGRSDGEDHEQSAHRTGACTIKASICNRRCGVSLDQSAWDRKAQC